MIRRCYPSLVRVICVSMTPDGGAMTAAMITLGFKPYSFTTPYSNGNGGAHPKEWHEVLTGKKRININFFDKYDCIVGPPGAVLFDKILAASPPYTKVILIEEPDKDQWAADMDKHIKPLINSAKRISKQSRVCADLYSMLIHMFPVELPPEEGGYAASLDIFEDRVKSVVPSERLLVWRFGEGYEPICDFLSIEKVPDEPFPVFDSGMETVGKLAERLDRANKTARVLIVIIIILACYTFAPLIYSGKDMLSEVYEDYSIAFQKVGEAGKEVTDIREAVAVAKDAMSLEEKWKAKGALSVITKSISG